MEGSGQVLGTSSKEGKAPTGSNNKAPAAGGQSFLASGSTEGIAFVEGA
jgi:hypothetical protein